MPALARAPLRRRVRRAEARGPRRTSGRARRWCASGWLLAALLALGPGCQRAKTPSILLFVLDTVRFDGVSANIGGRTLTPAFDALAAGGRLYTQAYAQSSWTLPSHASLFTGLLPSQHGVGVTRLRLDDGVPVLAERLAQAGYQTIGLTENPWIGKDFGLARGFERLEAAKPRGSLAAFDRALEALLAARTPERPLLLFVNVMDAHEPYDVGDVERFLPAGVERAEAAAVATEYASLFCRRNVPERTWAILRGLYLGAVARADAKLGHTLERVRALEGERPLIVVATADHGQHFGEHDLTQHSFSIRQALVHVPLAVHGLPGAAGTVIPQAVELTEVHAAMLEWAGVVPHAEGTGLPTVPDPASRRAARSEFFDYGVTGLVDRMPLLRLVLGLRRGCSNDDRVFDHMRTVIRPPFKLNQYRLYPVELYDIAGDPAEATDLARTRPELIPSLASALPVEWPEARAEGALVQPAPDALEQLRALGYVGR